jgi:16S rRNA (guanine966-N2)-methyltransferase
VLDCFAGSGALGLESLSRGAASVVFVEKARTASETLKANALSLGLEFGPRMRMVSGDLERSIDALEKSAPFDLWLVDPPFAMIRDGSAARMLSLLVRSKLLAEEGMVVVEYPSDAECPEIKGLECEEKRRYGDTFLAFFRNAPQVSSQEQA